jgi:hypothetical protein
MSVVGVDFGNSDCYIAQGEGSCFGGWAALQALAVAFTLEFPVTFALRSQARCGIDLILNENSNRKNP